MHPPGRTQRVTSLALDAARPCTLRRRESREGDCPSPTVEDRVRYYELYSDRRPPTPKDGRRRTCAPGRQRVGRRSRVHPGQRRAFLRFCPRSSPRSRRVDHPPAPDAWPVRGRTTGHLALDAPDTPPVNGTVPARSPRCRHGGASSAPAGRPSPGPPAVRRSETGGGDPDRPVVVGRSPQVTTPKVQ
jgi:hypothetical protein